MTILQAVVLGVVQGVAEFLPISSSAHLLILERWMRLPTGNASVVFDVWLHVATLAALLTVYGRGAYAWMCQGVRARRVSDRRFIAVLAVATIPAVAFGALASEWLQWVRTPTVAAYMLIGGGLLLWIADSAVSRAGTRRWEQMGWAQAVLTGCAQALALIPGVSRSGAVLTASRALGLSRADAVRWAFLLSVPVTAAAAAHALLPTIANGTFTITPPMFWGALVAWATGIGAIFLLRGLAERASFGWFAVYRVAVGAATLLLIYG